MQKNKICKKHMNFTLVKYVNVQEKYAHRCIYTKIMQKLNIGRV